MKKKTTNALELSKRLLAASLISASLTLFYCSSDDGHPRLKEFDEKTIYESTKGVITEVQEIEPGDQYTILDEKIIDDKSKSIAIVHTLQGTTDTLSLVKLKSDKDSTSHRHYSGLRGILFYSLARSFFTNNMSNVTPDSRYYKDATAYNKSAGLKNDLQSSAKPRNVHVPRGASSGYGKSKSFRSFGG